MRRYTFSLFRPQPFIMILTLHTVLPVPADRHVTVLHSITTNISITCMTLKWCNKYEFNNSSCDIKHPNGYTVTCESIHSNSIYIIFYILCCSLMFNCFTLLFFPYQWKKRHNIRQQHNKTWTNEGSVNDNKNKKHNNFKYKVLCRGIKWWRWRR